MQVATIRVGGGTTAVRAEGDRLVRINRPDVGALLADPDWRGVAEAADGESYAVDGADFAPLVPAPDKIVCVGLNYRSHILEMGHPLPDTPTLFSKYRAALIGAHDDIVVPPETTALDWEAELAVVVGAPVRRVGVADAPAAIAGYAVLNDVTARDWQNRTSQWLPGKTFEATTPLGPFLVTTDDPVVAGRDGFAISCEVDGEVVQRATTSDLVFTPAELVSYVSTVITLLPGDVIATGTPAGVGHARTPPRYLSPGSRVVTRIEGVGECDNRCVSGGPAAAAV